MKRKEGFNVSPPKRNCLIGNSMSNFNEKIITTIASFATNKNLSLINNHWKKVLAKPEIIDLTLEDDIEEVNSSVESIVPTTNFPRIKFQHFSIDFMDEFEWKWTLFEDYQYNIDFKYPLFTVDSFINLLQFLAKSPEILQSCNLKSLKQLFIILNPFITCCCTTTEEVKKLIETSYSILQQDQLYDEIFLSVEEFKLYKEFEFIKQPHFSIFNFCLESLKRIIVQYDDGHYVGELIEDIPNGQGTWMSLEDPTDNYFGFWMNGKKNGFGKYQNYKLIYDGEWKDDKFHGNGKLVNLTENKKGWMYVGEFVNGTRNGKGIQYYSGNGNYYRGDFENNKRHGLGELLNETEWKYGAWRYDNFHDGVGILNEPEEKKKFALKYQNYKEISKRNLIPTVKEKEDVYGPMMSRKTVHNGYYFKSRLEARWALFFEYLEIRYLYEPKSFPMPNNTTYTPDFYLPLLNLWIEIKPVYPTEEERYKAKELTNLTLFGGSRVMLLYGSVSPPFLSKFNEGAKGIEFKKDRTEIEPLCWCEVNAEFD